jgi:hypothetical protein
VEKVFEMSQANQSFKAALDAMHTRQQGSIMRPAQGIIKPNAVHNDRNCDCKDCRLIFRSEATLRTVPAVGNGPLPDRSLTPVEIAAKTIALMQSAGASFYGEMSKALPVGHRMKEAIRARALNNQPMLGHCRVGRVPLFQEGRYQTWAEFHLTNFDAMLDTRQNRKFYDVSSLERSVKAGGLFYGVAVITDTQGNTLDFNREVGDRGLYYQTKNKAEAAYAMAGISTGLSVNKLKELDQKNFKGYKNPDG